MTSRTKESVLTRIGIDPDERRMIVLRALIKAQKDHESFVTFEEFKESFRIVEGGKRVTDPLLYRSLTSLEKDGYIIVDRTGYRHRYGSNHKVMRIGLKKAKQAALEKLEYKADKVESEIEALSHLDSITLAEEFMSLMTGKHVNSKSIFAEGLQACFGVIDREICKSINRGDVIRFTSDWLRAEEDVEGKLTSIFECLGKSGAEVRVLCRSGVDNPHTDEFSAIIQKLHNLGYRVAMKKHPRDDATYQFVSKSGEGMLLIVAEAPLAATWISRESNLLLIDSAVASFEEDYAKAEKMTELTES
ncbi:MAG: hypothetical protein ACFFEA_10730 [Candidatus Thorarchaeota archaeon]